MAATRTQKCVQLRGVVRRARIAPCQAPVPTLLGWPTGLAGPLYPSGCPKSAHQPPHLDSVPSARHIPVWSCTLGCAPAIRASAFDFAVAPSRSRVPQPSLIHDAPASSSTLPAATPGLPHALLGRTTAQSHSERGPRPSKRRLSSSRRRPERQQRLHFHPQGVSQGSQRKGRPLRHRRLHCNICEPFAQLAV